MKLHGLYSPETGHTYPIRCGGHTLFADYTAAIHLAYGTKPVETAMFRDGTGGFRGFAVHQYHGEYWTVTSYGTYAEKAIDRGREQFDELVRLYAADPLWSRMVAECV
jgi:hypothetical protein